MDQATLLNAVTALCADAKPMEEGVDRAAVEIPATALLEIARKLRDSEELRFDMLCAHTAVDRLEAGHFELIYQLYSTRHRHYLMVSATVPREQPVAPSVSSVWAIAEWQEREVYDLFGVQYDNHPDLRRLFLEDDWQGHPLRKDYQDDFMLEME
jgi:NADH-quinone oxidoreductase subunit C